MSSDFLDSVNENGVISALAQKAVDADDRYIMNDDGVVMCWRDDLQSFGRVNDLEVGGLKEIDSYEVEVKTLESFTRLVDDFAEPYSAMFFNPRHGFFKLVIDHGNGQGKFGLSNKRVLFTPPLSRELRPWLVDNNGGTFTQDAFAEFIEDNIDAIVQPSGADLYGIINDLSITSSAVFSRTKRNHDGTVDLTYKTESEASNKTMQLPSEVTIAVPFFEPSMENMDPDLVELTLKLRYRLRDGQVRFHYKILGFDAIKRQAFAGLYESVSRLCPILEV